MAAYTSLLVIALCAAAAHCLICYTCDQQSTNAKCLTATKCISGEAYCQTTVDFVSIVGFSSIEITKKCVHNCSATNNSIKITSSNVTCCTTDLCNYSGGASIRSSCAAIILALGSVLIILKSSVL